MDQTKSTQNTKNPNRFDEGVQCSLVDSVQQGTSVSSNNIPFTHDEYGVFNVRSTKINPNNSSNNYGQQSSGTEIGFGHQSSKDGILCYDLLNDGASTTSNRWNTRVISPTEMLTSDPSNNSQVQMIDLDQLSRNDSDTSLAVQSILETEPADEQHEQADSADIVHFHSDYPCAPNIVDDGRNIDNHEPLIWRQPLYNDNVDGYGPDQAHLPVHTVGNTDKSSFHFKQFLINDGARSCSNEHGSLGVQLMSTGSLERDWNCHQDFYKPIHPNGLHSDPDSPLPVETSVECSIETETCEETASVISHTPYSPVESWTSESSVFPINNIERPVSPYPQNLSTNNINMTQSLPNFSVFSHCPSDRPVSQLPKKPVPAVNHSAPGSYVITPTSRFTVPRTVTSLPGMSSMSCTTPPIGYPLTPSPTFNQSHVAAMGPLNHHLTRPSFPRVSDHMLAMDPHPRFQPGFQPYNDIYPRYVPGFSAFPSPISSHDCPSPVFDYRSMSPFSPYEDRLFDYRPFAEPHHVPQPMFYGSSRPTTSPDMMAHTTWMPPEFYAPPLLSPISHIESPLTTPAKTASVSSFSPWTPTESVLTIDSSPESPLLTSSPSPVARSKSSQKCFHQQQTSDSRGNLTEKSTSQQGTSNARSVSTGKSMNAAGFSLEGKSDNAVVCSDIDPVGGDDGAKSLDSLDNGMCVETSLSGLSSNKNKKPEVVGKPILSSNSSKTVRELLDEQRQDTNPRPDCKAPVTITFDHSSPSPPLYGEPALCPTPVSITPKEPTLASTRYRPYCRQQKVSSTASLPTITSVTRYPPPPVIPFPIQRIPFLVRAPTGQLFTKFIPVGLPLRWDSGLPSLPVMPSGGMLQIPPFVKNSPQLRPELMRPQAPSHALNVMKVSSPMMTTSTASLVGGLGNVKSSSSLQNEATSGTPVFTIASQSTFTRQTVKTCSSTVTGPSKMPAGGLGFYTEVTKDTQPLDLKKPADTTTPSPSFSKITIVHPEDDIISICSSPGEPLSRASPDTTVAKSQGPKPSTLPPSKWKPKHFDFTVLTIGTFTYENSPLEPRISRLKLIFSKSCMMYEFQTNSMADTYATQRRLMAIIEVPFDTIVGMESYHTCLKIQVNKVPKMFVGQKSADEAHLMPQIISYCRDKTMDITGGQLLVTHHKLNMRNTAASRIVDMFRKFSPRLSIIAELPYQEDADALLSPDDVFIHKQPLPSSSVAILEGHKPLKMKKRCLTSDIRCRCNYGCKSSRCRCVQRQEQCGDKCRCKNCENPISLLVNIGKDATDMINDRCLVYNVFKHTTKTCNVYDYVNKLVEFPCCKIALMRRDCLPGIIPCPNTGKCKKMYRFSWCRETLNDEDVFPPLEHCTYCERCVEKNNHYYCSRCQKCYPQDSCPICIYPANVMRNVGLDEPTLNQLAQQDFDAYARHQRI